MTTYTIRRESSGWQVVDATGSVVSQHGPGSAGARAADVAASLLNNRQSAPGAELRTWRKAHQLTLKRLASVLGVHWITVQHWETGQASVPPFLSLALERLEQKVDHAS